MPELPEVETVCRGIRPHLIDRQIVAIDFNGKHLRQPVDVARLRQLLAGKIITRVTRRAKYLLIAVEDDSLLVIHLGMTGNLGIFSPEREKAKHCHLQFRLNDGMELRYTDTRRFGTVLALDSIEAQAIEDQLLKTAGPEPFAEEFTVDYLVKVAQKRSVAVKTFIMTSQVVVGVGNIYANESLFRAGIDPRRPASSLTCKEWHRLIDSIREILTHAIDCGGSTISDYVNANQESGYFQINFQVYGKAEKKCTNCGNTITKQQLNGRASYWCPHCQK